ncbi:MAG: flippase [Candidatus Thermoplasmatota archaeon]
MIARKSALIIFVQLLNGILGFVGLKFIALYMQPWEYGVIGFAYGFVALFSIFGDLGFGTAHVKRISEGKDLGKCASTFATIKLITTSVLASATFLSIAIWRYVFGRGFESPLHEQAVYLLLAYFILNSLTQTFTTTFSAKKEIAKANIPYFMYTLIRVIITIFVAYLGLGVLALAYTYLLGEIFQFSLAYYFFKSYKLTKPSIDYIKNYTKFAFPMAIASAASIIILNVDRVIIQLFWGAQQVGEYFAVFNLSRFIINFSTAVAVLLLPTISEYHAKNNMDDIRKLTLASERYLSMITFPIVILLVVLAEPVIRILLSDQYSPALTSLQILPFFVLFEVLSQPYQSQLQGMNMPHIVRNRIVIMMIVSIILNLILVPVDIRSLGIKLAGLGAMGSALAIVIAYFVGFITTRVYAFRVANMKGNNRILLHVLAAVLMGVILYLFIRIFPIGRWYELVGICVVGSLIYFCILFLLKEFDKKDFYLFWDTLNIKKMALYIWSEVRKK